MMHRLIMTKLCGLEEMLEKVNKGELGIIALDINRYGGGPILKENVFKNTDNECKESDNEKAEIVLDKQPKESVVRHKIERKTRSWKSYGWNVR